MIILPLILRFRPLAFFVASPRQEEGREIEYYFSSPFRVCGRKIHFPTLSFNLTVCVFPIFPFCDWLSPTPLCEHHPDAGLPVRPTADAGLRATDNRLAVLSCPPAHSS